MTPRTEGLILIIVLFMLSVVFQVQLKIFAGELLSNLQRTTGGFIDTISAFGNSIIGWRPVLIAVLAVALFSIWVFTLMRLDLSMALPLASVALALNALVGGMLLSEPISLTRLAGIIIIAVGVTLVIQS